MSASSPEPEMTKQHMPSLRKKSKHLENGMQLLYLDQCVTSRLVQANEDAGWSEVRMLLKKGRAQRRILVPLSLEHLVETAPMAETSGREIDTLLRHLSFGWGLKMEPIQIAAQINAAVRGMPFGKTCFLEKNLYYGLGPNNRDQLIGIKAAMKEQNEKNMQGYNTFVGITKMNKSPDVITLDFLLNLQTTSDRRAFLEELDEVIETGGVRIKPSPYSPNTAEQFTSIIWGLIKHHHFNGTSLRKLKALIVKDGLSWIPTLHVKSVLHAHAMFLQTKIKEGDTHDNARIACGLPVADILVTDSRKVRAIKDAGMDATYKTKVISTKEDERDHLIETLRAITDSYPPYPNTSVLQPIPKRG